MTTTGKQLNECGHELNTQVELLAGDVTGNRSLKSIVVIRVITEAFR